MIALDDYNEIIDELFEAINTIVNEKLRLLDFDKTITAIITDITYASSGKYRVTTDSNIVFDAFAEKQDYQINDRVYVRIPGNDYTKQKVIVGKFIPDVREKGV